MVAANGTGEDLLILLLHITAAAASATVDNMFNWSMCVYNKIYCPCNLYQPQLSAKLLIDRQRLRFDYQQRSSLVDSDEHDTPFVSIHLLPSPLFLYFIPITKSKQHDTLHWMPSVQLMFLRLFKA